MRGRARPDISVFVVRGSWFVGLVGFVQGGSVRRRGRSARCGARWYDGADVRWRYAWGLPAPRSDSDSHFLILDLFLKDAMITILKIDTPPHIKRTPQPLHITPR
jgi:hypothetical protein